MAIMPATRPFTATRDGGRSTYRTPLRGSAVLRTPLLNKGPAFTDAERAALGLDGLLPSAVVSMDTQLDRALAEYHEQPTDLAKNIFLSELQDRNEYLFYALLTRHLQEMVPIVYDPTVGQAIERYSHEYRRPRGVYLTIDRLDEVESSLAATGLSPNDVDLIVASDAEEILGIGDWGVGGIDIAVGKLAVYSAAAGVDPARVVPIMLDVGTNRESLLNDPLYAGYRHGRVRGEAYDAFIDAYVNAAHKLFPHALLHWEDFGPGNGRRIVNRWRDKLPTFNDDMQGTGAVVMAALLNAVKLSGIPWHEHRVVILGAGTAGVGIADQIRDQIMRDGLSEEAANRQFWLVDLQGLLLDSMHDLRDYQQPYARPTAEVAGWARSGPDGKLSLLDTVRQAKPTILIGTSTAPQTFTREVAQAMAAASARPIIFPLSNPTPLAEATPEQLLTWTNGKALVATGSPFAPVAVNGVTFTIGQANNALLYPGLGLGVIVSRASRISDGLFLAAAKAVAESADLHGAGAGLLPPVTDMRATSATVAVAVAKQAAAEGLAQVAIDDPVQMVLEAMWQPVYPTIEAV